MNARRLVLSASRTGSQALVAALSEGGTRPVGHLHFLGQRALSERVDSFKGRPLPAMLRQAVEMRSMIEDRGVQIEVATCVRDPMARQVSHLFRFPEIAMAAAGIDVYREPERAGAWMVQSFHRRRPLTWFEDHISEPFGVDVFDIPFDAAHRSLRLVRGGLRLVVLRLEDPPCARQTALGWLLRRRAVPIPVVDRTGDAPHGDAYRRFRASFRPPNALLDDVYGSRMMQHFYSADERQRMRDHWTAFDGGDPAF